MNNTWKTLTVTSILMILAAVSVHAQAGSSLVVKVPFDFTVSGKRLPAGKYVISRSTQASSEGMLIRNQQSGVYVQTKTIKSQDRSEETQVIFMRYGNEYFLFQIWISGRTTGRELFKSSSEKALAREYDLRRTKPETVAILGEPR